MLNEFNQNVKLNYISTLISKYGGINMSIWQSRDGKTQVVTTPGYKTTITRDSNGGRITNRTTVYENGPWKKTFVDGKCVGISYQGKKVR